VTGTPSRRQSQVSSPFRPRIAHATGYILAGFSAVWLIWAWATVGEVPFHPDEATYLYMANDGYTNPGRLAYDPDIRTRAAHYRLVNAPLTRYLWALSLRLANASPPPVDWLWEQTWNENRSRGALPQPDALLAARRTAVILIWLAGWGLYAAARNLGSPRAGLVAAVLFWLHPLVLLHGRRAMQEAALLATLAWLLTVLTAPRARAWLIGTMWGLALAAKAWALAWGPAVGYRALTERPRLRRALVVLLTASAVLMLLNPVAWRAPLTTARAAWQRRHAVTQGQVRTALALGSPHALTTPGARALALLWHLYLAPLQYAEVGNYQHALAAEQRAYDQKPWARWTHGPIASGALLVLTGLGLVQLARQTWPRAAGRAYLLVGAGMLAFYLAALPLAWQRYVVPWLPWLAVAWGWGVDALLAAWFHRA